MIKQLHLLHIITLITLFCAGIYWIGIIEQLGRPDDLFPSDNGIPVTRLAAFAAMVVFAFSAVVGWKVVVQKKILGIVWMIAGLVGVVWMVLMWLRPSHIALIEVFPFWLIYVIVGTAGSAYCLGLGQNTTINYDDDVLDN
jgi:hypothetical protein